MHRLRHRPIAITVILALALLAGCGESDESAGLPQATLEPLRIRAEADWIRDAAGRVVILRGANYSGLEFGNFVGAANGPQAADFAQLASWGINVIRLPIAWSYLEPSPNQFDASYLTEQVDTVIGYAAANGIAVILDMHFYLWSRCVGGLGAPAWICDGHNYLPGTAGFLQATCDFFRLEGSGREPARASDGRLLREHFLDAWRLVVRHYAADQRIIGWDYFNEPFGLCFGISGAFEQQSLFPFYRRMRAITQEERAERTHFFEPHVTRNTGMAATIEPFGPDVVYAPHIYGPGGDQSYTGDRQALHADYDLAVQEAAVLGGPLVVGEFGGNVNAGAGAVDNVALRLTHTYEELDQRLAGGTVWAYFPGDNGFSVVDAAGAEKGQLVDIIARPYARRIAGIPTAMSFDIETKEFNFTFRDDDTRRPPDPTEIFVPAARHYPNGFNIEISPGDRWQLDTTGTRLLFFRGANKSHSLRLTAR